MKLLAIFNLNTCTTPKLLVPLYWALNVAVLVNAWAFFVATDDWAVRAVIGLGMILGFVSVRILCELLLVPFKILAALEASKGE